MVVLPRIPPHRGRVAGAGDRADPPRAAAPGREVGRAESRTDRWSLILTEEAGEVAKAAPDRDDRKAYIAELVAGRRGRACSARGGGLAAPERRKDTRSECQQNPSACACADGRGRRPAEAAPDRPIDGAMRRDRRSSARGAGERQPEHRKRRHLAMAAEDSGRSPAHLFRQTGGKRPNMARAIRIPDPHQTERIIVGPTAP